MKIRLFVCAAALTTAALTYAGTIQFNGDIQMINPTSIPWVGPSTMWGFVQTGSMTGTGSSGFASLSSLDITKLVFTYGDLDLTTYQSPGANSPGFERYTPVGGARAFSVSYNSTVLATGTSVFMRSEVTNNADYNATGSGQAFLTSAGLDPAFFNEVMAQTGGTGLLNFTIDGFHAVDNSGYFTSTGSITAVPEPATYAALFGLAALGLALRARQRR